MRTIALGDPSYPPLLKEIHRPPGELHIEGTFLPEDIRAVAIVGTRSATPYGMKIAGQLAGQLAGRGMTVISGLAEGIDTAAHRGALEAGGRTIAVVGHGLDFLYPAGNRRLAQEIIASGALVSQFPLGVGPLKQNFPQRNRVIAGLSLGVVVIEAPERSGALITAREALEEGREVFAVPGPISSAKHTGCHKLIQDGAKLVQSVDDILEELAPVWDAEFAGADALLGPGTFDQACLAPGLFELLNAIPAGDAIGIEVLVQRLKRPPQELLPQLTQLELQGAIQSVLSPGGYTRTL